MKVGIVVPFSWSYPGAVVELAENQAAALRARGHEVKILMGNDPPGYLTRALHPRSGRHGTPPGHVIPVGRSVVVPANGSLPNIVLSPRSIWKVREVLREEQFDVIHLHEPMTPAICVAALAHAKCPIVATWHAAGDLGWMRYGLPVWGFLIDRIDARIAVSPLAASSAGRWLGDEFEIVPNGVVIPEHADPTDRDHTIVFIGRHDPRKGLPVLLRAWPEIHRRTGARLRLIGADPLQYRLLHARMGFDETGIDVLGIVTNEVRTHELARGKLFVSPATGSESFGLVLAEAFATATPVVASNIPGFAAVAAGNVGRLVPPGDEAALTQAIVDVLADEPGRVEMGRAARALAVERYAWTTIAAQLETIYERVTR
ncbi:MAG: glycosyltransferase family 4 protein [Actinomycetes bacterium]